MAAASALETLLDAGDAPELPLPEALTRRYGGALRMRERALVSNFVASIDGVVALRAGDRNSGSAISAHNDADRFVMGLLRACAGAVLIGAGTLRATPNHHWTAEHVYADERDSFAALRRSLGLAEAPQLYVLLGEGEIDPGHVALRKNATIIASAQRAAALATSLRDATVRALPGGTRLDIADVLQLIRDDGHERVLTEGGPHVIGELLRAAALDDMFLTVAPRLFGREPTVWRPGMAEGVAFGAGDAPGLTLTDVRHADSYLFLRYTRTAA